MPRRESYWTSYRFDEMFFNDPDHPTKLVVFCDEIAVNPWGEGHDECRMKKPIHAFRDVDHVMLLEMKPIDDAHYKILGLAKNIYNKKVWYAEGVENRILKKYDRERNQDLDDIAKDYKNAISDERDTQDILRAFMSNFFRGKKAEIFQPLTGGQTLIEIDLD